MMRLASQSDAFGIQGKWSFKAGNKKPYANHFQASLGSQSLAHRIAESNQIPEAEGSH
jgi:hypothetical protein